MPAKDRGGLKAAFTNFNKPDSTSDAAELKLLGRPLEEEKSKIPMEMQTNSYQVATTQLDATGGLNPKPLLQREAVRQLSFRCPISVAAELRRKAAFNQLEQQEIIVEGIRRVLLDLPVPPSGWES